MSKPAAAKAEAPPAPWAWALLTMSSLFALTAAVLLGFTTIG